MTIECKFPSNGGVNKHRFFLCGLSGYLGSLASDAAGQLNVLRHNCYTLGVDGSQVSVLEETDEVRLGRFLEC